MIDNFVQIGLCTLYTYLSYLGKRSGDITPEQVQVGVLAPYDDEAYSINIRNDMAYTSC